ncbi:murein DD-endopeptidase MepM/ murein hydrolase activator NlpD [Paraburkholderia eburnea]|uniref:Murein DD-endopeptidase MepM/ murein hydrolase activator NlpD n=1 Tax=Paraburkholderia eburnea TaxID=1189126 RepID=A0A2S4M4E6_9BURK|nr:M23 family metallopeptidase [Paraburkholderia eburnea]POR49469.1 murein DD-endopeptidase MepM/ murein hydrolase activator NlpD [Paraburkholderia eburnea]PRZ19901.1 murein DD-endopeptidase MepM/ murein hydrolase activator NlpD [Paraburkholderia eburnea]
MTAFHSLLARGQDISTAAKLPVKRKTLCGVVALLALCASATSVPGAHAAVSTAFSYGPAFERAPLAQDVTLPGAPPVTSFDAIWPSLRDVDGVFAQPFAQRSDIATFGARVSSDEIAPGTVCSRLASMCLPLADLHDEQTADGSSAHKWFGHVTSLQTIDGYDLPTPAVQAAAGPIDTTLRESLEHAGLPASVTAQIASLFAGHVDPDARAQAGDTFRVMLDSADGPGTPRVASIELRLQGETYDALWFTPPGAAHGAYYTLDGALLAGRPFSMPLDYRRVSSPFGMRTHPVFGEPRFHEGVDLTAPAGTPIYAAATGTLELAASERGYGKLVVLRHDSGYSTRYAHLASWAVGLKSGQRIEQGQVIGYVGRTGVTTGAHLHFEVRHNDEPLDPLTLTSHEFVAPLGGTARMAFEARVEAARTSLAALPQPASRMASIMTPRRFIG